ncbi:MAG TPA: hypothetical protein QGF58_20555 [Myxococcota bacterium]|nr:hypothetical protein [Myxococcota bacterium]
MADAVTLARFWQLYESGYLPSVGSWVQVAPDSDLTTVLNAFNSLGEQQLEIFLIDQSGSTVVWHVPDPLATNKTLRIDLETIIPAESLPFEGAVWVWALGDSSEGSIGLQAIDLDFVDRTRPEGHSAGSVHIVFDFINTLSMGPFMDYVSPRVLVDATPEGSQRYQNYLGVAHIPLELGTAGMELEISLTNEAGETQTADPIELESMGSWFGSLEALFPGMPEFLARDGEDRGYGTVNVREANGRTTGLAGMLKVVDVVNSSLMVNHLNDRNFARPAMKED